jgi:hypothetical protein
LKRAPKKFSPEMLATGGEGGREKFSRRTIPKLHVFDQIFSKKLGNFETKRAPLVLISIYSDISLYKKGTFHHKKGHFSSQKRDTFSPLKKLGGGHVLPVSPPPVPTPLPMLT